MYVYSIPVSPLFNLSGVFPVSSAHLPPPVSCQLRSTHPGTLVTSYLRLSKGKEVDFVLRMQWSILCHGPVLRGRGGIPGDILSSHPNEEWRVGALEFPFFVFVTGATGRIFNHFGLYFLHQQGGVVVFTFLTFVMRTVYWWDLGCPELNLVWNSKGLSTESNDGDGGRRPVAVFCRSCSSECWC